jgi:hypothetical protein
MQFVAKGTKTLNPSFKKNQTLKFFKTPIGARSCNYSRIVGH